MRSTRTRQMLAVGAVCAILVTTTSCSPTLDIDALAAETTDFQRAIIADGSVTPAEYETAILARRDCVVAAGATPGEIYAIGNNERTFDFEVTAESEAAMNAVWEKADVCLDEYLSAVGTVWAFQQ